MGMKERRVGKREEGNRRKKKKGTTTSENKYRKGKRMA